MNAVFERDYVRASVAKHYLWMRAGFAIAVAGIVAILVMGAHATGDFTNLGGNVLDLTVVAGVVLLAGAAPAAFGTSLVRARAQNALPVLFASPITPFQLSWGAFTARAAGLSVFVFACWPPIAIALAYGGVRPGQVAAATAALLGTLLIVGAPAFVISAWARSTGPAVVGAYVAAASILTGLTALGSAISKASPLLASSLSPVEALRVATDPQRYAVVGGGGSWVLLVIGLTVSLAAILTATLRIDREARGGLDAEVATTAGRPYLPLRYENPILDREVRTGGALRSRSTRRTLVGVLIAAEAAYVVAAWRGNAFDSLELFTGFLVFETALLVLAAAAAGATSLASEKESGALDIIRVTPIPPSQIIQGKLLGLFRTLLPALAVPCAHLLIGSAFGILSIFAVPAYLIAGGVVSATWIVIGVQQSLDQREPAAAVKRTMGVILIFGMIFGAYLGMAASGLAPTADWGVRITCTWGLNPVGAILSAVAPLRTGGSSLEMTSVPPPSDSDITFGLATCMVWLLLHAFVARGVARGLATYYRTRFEG
ncbi:MAG: hypothetical protein K8T90_20870 [Planctomycetes bacterium]|nr:hypothetical protein [Planctomycetota bacterium]